MHQSLASLACLAFLFATVPGVNAADADRCPSIAKFESASKNDKKRIVLSSKAHQAAECASSEKGPSLDGLLESKVLDWWVVHTPDEDIGRISSIAERNRTMLTKAIESRNVQKRGYVFGFWGAELNAVLTAAAHICSLQFIVSGERRIYISAVQQFEDKDENFCEGLAVMLAVHGVTLDFEGEDVLVSVPN